MLPMYLQEISTTVNKLKNQNQRAGSSDRFHEVMEVSYGCNDRFHEIVEVSSSCTVQVHEIM